MELRKLPSRVAIAVVLSCVGFYSQRGRAELSPDEQVIAQLKEAGSNLSKPHAIEFYLYFPSKAVANSMVERVQKLGLRIVRVDKAATGSDWLLLAAKKIVPTKDAIEKLTAQLTAIAADGKGQYDGWEAEVTK